MHLEIDKALLEQTGLSENDLKIELAIALYKRGKLSIGQASRFVDLHKMEFQRELGRRGETLNYDETDLQNDLNTLKDLNL